MNIILKELLKEDLPIVKDWIDPAIFRIFKAPIDDAQLSRLLTKNHNGILTDIGKKAIDADSGNCVGFIHAVVNPRDNHIHIQQMVVAPQFRHQGYGTSIMKCFLEVCFKQYKFHRVQLMTEEHNHAAVACYQKVGFHVDGLLRDISKFEGRYISEYMFSILEQEWKGTLENE